MAAFEARVGGGGKVGDLDLGGEEDAKPTRTRVKLNDGASGAGAGAGGATEPGLVVKKTMSAAERAKAVAEWQADGEPGGLKEL